MIENSLRQTSIGGSDQARRGIGTGNGSAPDPPRLTSSAAAQDDVWAGPPDLAKAAEQARDFQTYGMPDDWANYGGVLRHWPRSMASS